MADGVYFLTRNVLTNSQAAYGERLAWPQVHLLTKEIGRSKEAPPRMSHSPGTRHPSTRSPACPREPPSPRAAVRLL